MKNCLSLLLTIGRYDEGEAVLQAALKKGFAGVADLGKPY